MNRKIIVSFVAIYCFAAGLGFFLSSDRNSEDLLVASYILQGTSTEAAAEAVVSVDGLITHEFRIINAVAATLTYEQRDNLQVHPAILAINEDAPAKAAHGIDTRSNSIADIDSGAPAVLEL